MDKKRVLLVDDETSFTWILKLSLERTGTYDVRTEHQGSRGLAAAKEFQPDLILLDVMMPDVDGSSVATQLKGDPVTQQIPIVFLTAAVAPEEADAQGGIIGGYPFLAKPVTLERVVACLQQYLGR